MAEKTIEWMQKEAFNLKMDWDAFRCEVAKQCLPALIQPLVDDGIFPDPEEVAGMAIVYADELIKELKKIQ